MMVMTNISANTNVHMGQFPEDGNFGRFMSNFFKQKATVAKPIDIDDF